MMIEGRAVSACAFAIAARSAPRSFASATDCTCQPRASNRLARSSVNEIDVVPSIVMWLSS